MATKHNQINLLPARWKTSTSLTEVQKKLQSISFVVLGVYIVVVLAILGWLGFLKVRQFQIASDTKNVSGQLAKFRHVEAAQEILESKAGYGLQAFKNKINAGIALNKGTRLFSNTLQLSQLTVDSTGKFGLAGIASGSAGAAAVTGIMEDPQGEGRKLFAKGLAILDRDRQGKITLTFDFQFQPSVPMVDLNK